MNQVPCYNSALFRGQTQRVPQGNSHSLVYIIHLFSLPTLCFTRPQRAMKSIRSQLLVLTVKQQLNLPCMIFFALLKKKQNDLHNFIIDTGNNKPWQKWTEMRFLSENHRSTCRQITTHHYGNVSTSAKLHIYWIYSVSCQTFQGQEKKKLWAVVLFSIGSVWVTCRAA